MNLRTFNFSGIQKITEVVNNWNIFKAMFVDDRNNNIFIKICLPDNEALVAMCSDKDEPCYFKAQEAEKVAKNNEDYLNQIHSHYFINRPSGSEKNKKKIIKGSSIQNQLANNMNYFPQQGGYQNYNLMNEQNMLSGNYINNNNNNGMQQMLNQNFALPQQNNQINGNSNFLNNMNFNNHQINNINSSQLIPHQNLQQEQSNIELPINEKQKDMNLFKFKQSPFQQNQKPNNPFVSYSQGDSNNISNGVNSSTNNFPIQNQNHMNQNQQNQYPMSVSGGGFQNNFMNHQNQNSGFEQQQLVDGFKNSNLGSNNFNPGNFNANQNQQIPQNSFNNFNNNQGLSHFNNYNNQGQINSNNMMNSNAGNVGNTGVNQFNHYNQNENQNYQNYNQHPNINSFNANMFAGQNTQSQVQALNSYINKQMPINGGMMRNPTQHMNMNLNMNNQQTSNYNPQDMYNSPPSLDPELIHEFSNSNTVGGYINDLKFKEMSESYMNNVMGKSKKKQLKGKRNLQFNSNAGGNNMNEGGMNMQSMSQAGNNNDAGNVQNNQNVYSNYGFSLG